MTFIKTFQLTGLVLLPFSAWMSQDLKVGISMMVLWGLIVVNVLRRKYAHPTP